MLSRNWIRIRNNWVVNTVVILLPDNIFRSFVFKPQVKSRNVHFWGFWGFGGRCRGGDALATHLKYLQNTKFDIWRYLFWGDFLASFVPDHFSSSASRALYEIKWLILWFSNTFSISCAGETFDWCVWPSKTTILHFSTIYGAET